MALVTLRQVRTPAHRGQAFECPYWQLERGEKWLIAGGNGSGKTTMAKVISGMQYISRGRVEFAPSLNTKDFELVSFEQQQKFHTRDDRFDDSELREDANDPGTTVAEFLGRDFCQTDAYKKWLNEFGLNKLEGHGIRWLSTGEMRKVLLARAVLLNAAVLILDDPMAGLDAQTQQELTQLLQKVFAELNTVLVLSAGLTDLSWQCTHLAVLRDGQVLMAEKLTAESLRSARAILQPKISPSNAPEKSSWPLPAKQNKEPPETLIRMDNVSLSFSGQVVFRGLSWIMSRGNHTAISGPNGCGKSSLLAMLNGENSKAYGQSVSLFGTKKGSGESIWQLRENFGVVSTALQQQYAKGYKALDVVLSGFQDSLGLYLECSGQERELAEQWLEIVGAATLSQRKFDSLSYGQQKIVLIARAMVKQPVLLVLDEPCIGLDPLNKKRVLQLLDDIAANSKTHLLFVSHVSDERPSCINQQLQFVWDAKAECYGVKMTRM